MPKDPVESGEGAQEGYQSPDKSGEQNGKQSEMLIVSEEQYNKLVEGWREDREEADKEIATLRKELRTSKPSDDDEDELEGLDENERVEKLIELRESKKDDLEKAETRKMASEIRFFERTSKEFADNKSAILKTAKEYECTSLKQAVMVWRGLDKGKADRDAAYHDKRKKEADGRDGGKGAFGKTEVRPYDKKTEGNKSFGQMFREGGVR